MAQTPAQLANLEKGKATQFTGENAASLGAKGAAVSAEVRRARKTLRTELELLLQTYVKDPKTGKQSEKTIQEAITLALDTKAYEIIRDTIGEKPADRITMAQIDQDTIDAVEKMVMGDDK